MSDNNQVAKVEIIERQIDKMSDRIYAYIRNFTKNY